MNHYLKCSEEAENTFCERCFDHRMAEINKLARVAEAAQRLIETQDSMPGDDLGATMMAACWIELRASLKEVLR